VYTAVLHSTEAQFRKEVDWQCPGKYFWIVSLCYVVYMPSALWPLSMPAFFVITIIRWLDQAPPSPATSYVRLCSARLCLKFTTRISGFAHDRHCEFMITLYSVVSRLYHVEMGHVGLLCAVKLVRVE